MVFSVDERERVRARLLELAHADARVVAGAVIGADAHGSADRWSDLDLTFGLAGGASVSDVLADWTKDLSAELDAVFLFDLRAGATTYRVFLLPGNLQVDLSFSPGADFGPRGPKFRLLFGTVGKQQPAEPPSAGEMFGLGAHHAVRARFSIERAKPWQAEYWISGVRDQALALACRRRGLESSYGRGFDLLPPELLDEVAPALVRSLERSELLRALAAALDALLHEAEEAREVADRLERQLRELATAPFTG